MSENTAIEWATHTFNPWSGCAKVSAGCTNCYAANLPPGMRRHAEWGELREGRDRARARGRPDRRGDERPGGQRDRYEHTNEAEIARALGVVR